MKRMKKGSVLVDIAIDQGGCFATSHATTHAEPTYIKHDIVHYCVANMPGAVARTSTFALNDATLPFAAPRADRPKGHARALAENPHLLAGSMSTGAITYQAVSDALGVAYCPAAKALAA